VVFAQRGEFLGRVYTAPVMITETEISEKFVVYSTGERLEGKCMRFRLLYDGRLLGASRSDTRAPHKHEIRRELSPQLKRLWETDPNLFQVLRTMGNYWLSDHPEDKETLPSTDDGVRQSLREFGLRYWAHKWERGSHGFIPLVTQDMELRCSLDILFLRPEAPGMLIRGADLDNRLKTLFDALRLPANLDEMGGSIQAGEPTYCLLEDDRLISEIKVTADHLLLLPKEESSHSNDVFLVIEVSLFAPPQSKWRNAFG